MQCLPDGQDYLEFNPGALESVRRLYGFETREDVDKAVDVLTQWVQRQSHFMKKDFSREYLEVLIMEAKGSVEKAKVRLDKLCTFRTVLPEFFGDFDVMVDFKGVFEDNLSMAILPKPTKENYRILLENNPGTKSYSGEPLALTFFRNLFLILELERTWDYAVGFELVLDFTKLDVMAVMRNLNLIDLLNGFSIIQKCRVSRVKRDLPFLYSVDPNCIIKDFAKIVHQKEGYGLRIKSVHVVTTNKYFHLLHKAMTQCFSQKLMSRYRVHATMETVYSFIDKDLMPADYGGKQKPLAELCKMFTEKIRSERQRAHIREMLKARTNEALRDKGNQNQDILDMTGTFRTLTVD